MNSKHIRSRCQAFVLSGFVFAIGWLVCVSTTFASSPTHRYSFDSNADDSIGVAHGTLLGNAVITNGAVALDGTNGCVQLPNDMFTNYQSLSFEIWVALDMAVSGTCLYEFDAGSASVITYQLGSGYLAYYTAPLFGTRSVSSPALNAGRTNHVVWTQDQASHIARIYTNGVLATQNSANFTLTPQSVGSTTNNYIGARSTNDSVVNGRYLEFRVYSNALTAFEVSLADQAGANHLPDDPERIRLVAPPIVSLGGWPTKIFVDFQNTTNVDLTGFSGVQLLSSDTNVIMVTASNLFKASGLGTANISVSYGSRSDSKSVTVLPAENFTLAHRYDFSGAVGQTNLPDIQGGADGRVFVGTFTSDGRLNMNGSSAYVDLPDGILSSKSEVTVEAWVTRLDSSPIQWPRIFDFGSRYATNSSFYGSTYFFLSPAVVVDNSGTNFDLVRFAVTTNSLSSESPQLTAHPRIPINAETHLAVTYNPAGNLSKLYINGLPVSSGPAPYQLNSLIDTNNWLGRSQWAFDTYFRGYFNEFRIYRKALNDPDIAASYALGPDVIGVDYMLHAQAVETNLLLTWGSSASGFILKGSPSVGADAIWTNVPVTPVFTNGHFEATIPASESTGFIRLSAP